MSTWQQRQRVSLINSASGRRSRSRAATGGANRFTGVQSAHNEHSVQTAEVIAEQFNVGHATVRRAEKFADAVDTLAETFGQEIWSLSHFLSPKSASD